MQSALGWFLIYLTVGTLLFAAFTAVYLWVTPYDEEADIKAGKLAPAIALVGAELGFTAPLCTASIYGVGLLDFVVWAVVACVVQLAIFKALYWRFPHSIEEDNRAAALAFAGASICIGLINAAALVPWGAA